VPASREHRAAPDRLLQGKSGNPLRRSTCSHAVVAGADPAPTRRDLALGSLAAARRWGLALRTFTANWRHGYWGAAVPRDIDRQMARDGGRIAPLNVS
jgi:hypothetical protein